MKKFNKKGVYLFAIKNLHDEVEVYWDKEYEYDIYYFESKKAYNEQGGISKFQKKFLIETVKGNLPKDLKNAEYMLYDTGDELEPKEFVDNAPINFDKSKFYCVVIAVPHIDALVYEMNTYNQKVYEFKTEKDQQAFIKSGANTGKLIEDKDRVLYFKDSKDDTNVVYLLSSKIGTKIFKKEYLLAKEIFFTTSNVTKVIFYPSLDTYVFNCHEDCIFEAIQNLSFFSPEDFDYDKFIQEVKSLAVDCKNFTCKYIGKASEVNPDKSYYDFDDECVYFVNTFFKLDIIWKLKEIDAINHVINIMK